MPVSLVGRVVECVDTVHYVTPNNTCVISMVLCERFFHDSSPDGHIWADISIQGVNPVATTIVSGGECVIDCNYDWRTEGIKLKRVNTGL